MEVIQDIEYNAFKSAMIFKKASLSESDIWCLLKVNCAKK